MTASRGRVARCFERGLVDDDKKHHCVGRSITHSRRISVKLLYDDVASIVRVMDDIVLPVRRGMDETAKLAMRLMDAQFSRIEGLWS